MIRLQMLYFSAMHKSQIFYFYLVSKLTLNSLSSIFHQHGYRGTLDSLLIHKLKFSIVAATKKNLMSIYIRKDRFSLDYKTITPEVL